MMDTKEFFIKAKRICESSRCREECPLQKYCDMLCFDFQKIDGAVEVVENYKLEES